MNNENKYSELVNKLTARFAAMRFFTTSVVVHMVLVLALGGVVLFRGAQDKAAFEAEVGNSGILAESQEMEDNAAGDEVPLEFEEAPAPSTEMESSASAITAALTDSINTFNISAPNTEQMSGNSFRGTVNRPLSSAGSLGGGKLGGGRAGMSGSLFGVKVNSKKLGVILDISFSTHNFIDVALNEIEKSFPTAIIVLAPGCGIAPDWPGEIVAGDAYYKNLEEYTLPNTPGQSATFLSKLMQDNKGFDTFWQRGNRERRMFILHTPNHKKRSDYMIYNSQHALRYLDKQGVDTVYWLADFADPIDKGEMEVLVERYKTRGIRVIQHNLQAKAPAPVKVMLANETGGTVIQGKGGKQKK